MFLTVEPDLSPSVGLSNLPGLGLGLGSKAQAQFHSRDTKISLTFV